MLTVTIREKIFALNGSELRYEIATDQLDQNGNLARFAHFGGIFLSNRIKLPYKNPMCPHIYLIFALNGS